MSLDLLLSVFITICLIAVIANAVPKVFNKKAKRPPRAADAVAPQAQAEPPVAKGITEENSKRAQTEYDAIKLNLLNGSTMNELRDAHNHIMLSNSDIFNINNNKLDIKRTSSHPIWTIDLTDKNDQNQVSTCIADVKKYIMDIIKQELQISSLPLTLITKLDGIFNAAKFRAIEEAKEEYCEIELNGKKGELNYIRIGAIGMKRIESKNENKVMLCAALHFQEWKENGLNGCILNPNSRFTKDLYIKAAKYELIQEIEDKIQVAKAITQNKIDNEGGRELYDWLNTFCRIDYYNAFKENGFDTKDVIADIDKHILENVIKIEKAGHVMKFLKEIQKLKNDHQYQVQPEGNVLC